MFSTTKAGARRAGALPSPTPERARRDFQFFGELVFGEVRGEQPTGIIIIITTIATALARPSAFLAGSFGLGIGRTMELQFL